MVYTAYKQRARENSIGQKKEVMPWHIYTHKRARVAKQHVLSHGANHDFVNCIRADMRWCVTSNGHVINGLLILWKIAHISRMCPFSWLYLLSVALYTIPHPFSFLFLSTLSIDRIFYNLFFTLLIQKENFDFITAATKSQGCMMRSNQPIELKIAWIFHSIV